LSRYRRQSLDRIGLKATAHNCAKLVARRPKNMRRKKTKIVDQCLNAIAAVTRPDCVWDVVAIDQPTVFQVTYRSHQSFMPDCEAFGRAAACVHRNKTVFVVNIVDRIAAG
jgi:hypothetical protein